MKYFLLSFLAYISIFSATKYPDIWWQPVKDPHPPSWEILPQSASREKNEVILSKRTELGILSNFAATPFSVLGTKYASLEGFWQCMKFPEGDNDYRFKIFTAWPKTRAEVKDLTAFDALRAGKESEKIMKAQNITWVSFNGYKIEYKGKDADAYYEIIEAATRAKIDQNPKVKDILLATGDLTLRPDHHEDKDGTKAWKYYEIYMKLRGELKKNSHKKLYYDDWFNSFVKKYNLPKTT